MKKKVKIPPIKWQYYKVYKYRKTKYGYYHLDGWFDDSMKPKQIKELIDHWEQTGKPYLMGIIQF